MAIFLLATQYLQATEVRNTLSFTGYNNSTLSVTTNTEWVSDTINIIAYSEASYVMDMYVNSAQTHTDIGRLAFGYGDGSIAVATDTPWVTDTISIATTDADTRSVLDQFISSASGGTYISRNALFIGDGSITTSSTYKGFNALEGEASTTGIYIEGNGYGILIQSPLEFNAGFGGIRESIAAAGGNPEAEGGNPHYSVQQFGYVDADGSGDFTPQQDYRVLMGVSGDRSATITSSNYGSSPQQGPDTFRANTVSWASGDGAYSFASESQVTQLYVDWAFGWGNSTVIVDDSSPLEVSDYFSAN